MTILRAIQVADYFIQAGGPKNRAVAWTAVAMGESDFNTEAKSPVGATGLWQFMPGSWPAECGLFSNATNPYTNARATVILSGGGVNFAPWDSSYKDIYKSGRYSFLAWPEVGSADYANIPRAQALIGNKSYGSITPPVQPNITGTLPAALSWYSQVANSVAPGLTRSILGSSAAARKQY
jgi:hypothetical protein